MRAGHTQTDTADLIGVDKSTISRELHRNSVLTGYSPQQAHQFCLQRRDQKATTRINPFIWLLLERLIRVEWSPEQVSGWLQSEYQASISIEWIYQYILSDKRSGGSLYKYKRCQKQRKKRYGDWELVQLLVKTTSKSWRLW